MSAAPPEHLCPGCKDLYVYDSAGDLCRECVAKVEALIPTLATETVADLGAKIKPSDNGSGPGSSASTASSATDAAPSLDPKSAALYGLAGDVVRALEDRTEADPAALLVNVLAPVRLGGGADGPGQGRCRRPPALALRRDRRAFVALAQGHRHDRGRDGHGSGRAGLVGPASGERVRIR